jgi:hypothetical protein
VIPGGRYALSVIHPGSPVLRVRYRDGVVINPAGYPDWLLYARAVVELAPPPAGLGRDEVRVLDVIVANEVMAAGDDPLWEFTRADDLARTPAGWVWAHLGGVRRLALVPAELHGAFRHAGGVRTMGPAEHRRGLRNDDRTTNAMIEADGWLAADTLAAFETWLGHPLPQRYREFFQQTNGGRPAEPVVHPGFGFVLDQPFFGLGRDDRHQDLPYAADWFGDRLTEEFLAVGYVQGGVLALKVRGDDADSIWYLDDDDQRDEDSLDAGYICANLLHRCADGIDHLLRTLIRPPVDLLRIADELITSGGVREVRPQLCGGSLPGPRRAPWQPPPDRVTQPDPVVKQLEIR